jgi:hypothetical protein
MLGGSGLPRSPPRFDAAFKDRANNSPGLVAPGDGAVVRRALLVAEAAGCPAAAPELRPLKGVPLRVLLCDTSVVSVRRTALPCPAVKGDTGQRDQ